MRATQPNVISGTAGAEQASYPLLGSYAIGGQQNYQSTTVQAALARRHVNIVSHYPGWQNSRGTTMAAVMNAVKAQSVIGTKMFIYMIYSEINKANANAGQSLWEPYQYINTNHLFAYTNGLAETGPLDADFGASTAKVNYTLGGKFVAGRQLYQYFIDWHIGVSRDGVGASNGITTLTAPANVHVDGFFFDNIFYRERTNADYDRNGSPDGLTAVAQMQAIQNSHAAAAAYYRIQWPEALLLANSADWREYETAGGYGSFSNSVLSQKYDGGAIESIQNYESLAFSSLISAIATQRNAYLDAKLGIMGWDIGSLTNYSLMRYGLGVSLLTSTYYYPFVGAYRSEDLPNLWFDEFDFDLGQPTEPIQTSARYLAGSAGTLGEGIWRRDFDNGIVLVAARRSNGATTPYAMTSLGGTFYRLVGTQAPSVNNGAATTFWTPAPREALVLSRIPLN